MVDGDAFSISIHAAREGGDGGKMNVSWIRGISIHAAREGGDCKFCASRHGVDISIHAAREGGDLTIARRTARVSRFQSTPPVKAATFAFRFKCGHGFNFNPRRP